MTVAAVASKVLVVGRSVVGSGEINMAKVGVRKKEIKGSLEVKLNEAFIVSALFTKITLRMNFLCAL